MGQNVSLNMANKQYFAKDAKPAAGKDAKKGGK